MPPWIQRDREFQALNDSLLQIIQQNSQPLDPIERSGPSRLAVLSGIGCVLFDVYGTLFISGSGDVGTADKQFHETAFRGALKDGGIAIPEEAPPLSPILQEEIHASHAAGRAEGTEFPEVEICEIWQRVLKRLPVAGGLEGTALRDEELEELAVRFEIEANPVWPMPGCRECLENLKSLGLVLGIISNAQFYTPLLFEALLGQSLDALGFQPNLKILSFEHRRAKPGLYLYELARQRLADLGFSPSEVLYVGNDMLKDIYPAMQVGFRTALFAGDARSLRLRETDERTQNLAPDLILTSLADLPKCLSSNK